MPEEKAELLHNVFISWSGERSKFIALALRKLLPMVLQASKPFMSESDIDRGSRGLLELARALEATKVGIVCLTPENLEAGWLLFEAGALSKTLDRETRIFTYLLAGLKPGDVRPPLGQFQATAADEEQTARMFQEINKTLGSQVSEENLSELFKTIIWPNLKEKLSTLPAPANELPPQRSEKDMIAEILENSRAILQMRETIHDVSDQMSRRTASLVDALRPMRDQSFFQQIESLQNSAAARGMRAGLDALAGLAGEETKKLSLKDLMEVPERKDKAKA